MGNQVGGGNGRKLATAAGAVGGGFIGNRIDRNH
ncbi:glycine zipper 2TM domain-containing protein, partial [Xanthomonas perforans]